MSDITDEYDLTVGGTLPKYTDTEVLESKINEYFEEGCKEKREVVTSGGEVVEVAEKLPTISGLALYLGFASRQSIYDYAKRNKSDKLAYVVKKALLRIDKRHESKLYFDKPVGSIFYLKHRGMLEAQASNSPVGNGESVEINID